MQLFLPKQHGAWAMLIIPFWLGVATSGFLWEHIPFFFGWLLLYLATYPLLLIFKKKKVPFYSKWAAIYFVPAVSLLLIVLISRPSMIYFGLIMIPFFFVNAYFSGKNQDRALLNDLSAIITFSIAGLASSYLPEGEINENAILIFTASILFFIGSTFFVKSMIREKKNVTFKWISWGYHFLVPLAWLVSGEWIVAIAFIPSLIRAIVFYGKPLSPKQIGIYEIVNSVLFTTAILLAIFA
jgi:hypothetical protein